MKYKVGDCVRIKDTSIEGTIENIIRGQLIVNYKGSKIPVWPEEVFLMESVEEETNACQKCVFAVYDDKPHCGLRGFRSDFNVERCSAENDTIPNGYELQEDGYFSWIEKKKEYPKTYEECCKVLHYACEQGITMIGVTRREEELFKSLIVLKRCRDAYWKLYGEEIGLGKPWEPDTCQIVYSIGRDSNRISFCNDMFGGYFILEFPTEEMRDAFYENFKEFIEQCKELL